MSHYAMTWAFQQTGLKPATKLVLLRISDAHNTHTGYAEISYKYLVADCEISKNTILAHLNILMDLRLVQKCRQTRDNGGHAYNRYLLAYDHPEIMEGGSEIEQGGGSEIEPEDSAETEQGLVQPDCTRVVQTVEQGKKQEGIEDTPLNPPMEGGNLVEDRILEFKPSADWAKDLAQRVGMLPTFIDFAVPRWRKVALGRVQEGSRIRSCASNFENWLKKHPDLQAMKREFVAETKTALTAPRQKLTEEVVYSTQEGEAALKAHVGGAFYAACVEAGEVLHQGHVAELIAKAAEKEASDMDDIARKAWRVTKEREKLLAEKYLKAEKAAE